MQKIIAFSREFGSGGHEIAERIAKACNLAFYDRNLLDEIAKEKLVDAGLWEQFDEAPKNRIFHRTVRGHSSSPEENLARMQFEFLEKKAQSGESFVIVGRCAETVLHGTEGLITIFILGDRPAKIKRIEEKYKLSEAEAIAKMSRDDKHRKMYHNKYSKYKWGDSRNYDLCINSSILGVDGTVKLITQYIQDFEDRKS